MKFGSPFAAGFGSPQNHIAELKVVSRNGNTSLGISFIPTSGYGNAVFGIYVNSVPKQFIYANDGQWTSEIRVSNTSTSGKNSVTVVRLGHIDAYDMTRIVRSLEVSSSDKVTLNWVWNTDTLQPAINSDGSEETILTNWSLVGVNIDTINPSDQSTRRYVDVNLTVTGGSALVELSVGETLVASGTVAFPGTCTLTQQNTSGISGTVDVAAGATTDTNMKLYFRRPASVKIKRGVVDPPTTVVATVPYSGRSSDTWTEPSPLSSGTYYYRIQSVSDTGMDGSSTATLTAVVPGPPNPITNLAYYSGDVSNTVLRFTASTTPGATYRLYLRKIGAAFFDLKNIMATAASGATSIALPAITGYPGTVKAIVRAVNAGTEEQNLNFISIEYDGAGAKVNPRPNSAAFSDISISAGRTITCTGMYDPTDEIGVATGIQLFSRLPANTYDFANPEATFTLVAGEKKPIKTAVMTKTYSTNGYRYITVKAATALGAQSTTEAVERLIYITNGLQSAPADATVYVSRG